MASIPRRPGEWAPPAARMQGETILQEAKLRERINEERRKAELEIEDAKRQAKAAIEETKDAVQQQLRDLAESAVRSNTNGGGGMTGGGGGRRTLKKHLGPLIEPYIEQIDVAMDAAAGSAGVASSKATEAAVSATVSTDARDRAEVAALGSNVYPVGAETNVPRGVTGAAVSAAGSGGTNGTFALAFSGGNFLVNPTGTFTVAGGVLTAINITGPGLYIGSAPSAPAVSFAASAGLMGAAASLTVGFRVPSGGTYWVLTTDGSVMQEYLNNAATPSIVSGAVLPTSATILAARAKSVPWLLLPSDGAGGVRVPALHWKPSLGKAWINGRVRIIADIATNNGDGSYTLNEMPAGLSNGVIALAKWTRQGFSGVASGNLWSMMANLANAAGEVAMNVTYQATPEMVGMQVVNRAPASNVLQNMLRYGKDFGVVAVPPNGGTAIYALEDTAPTIGTVSTQYQAPIAFTIGRRAQTGQPNVLTNLGVEELIIYTGTMTSAEIEALMDAYDPLTKDPQTTYPMYVPVLTKANGEKKLPAYAWRPGQATCWYAGRERPVGDVLTNGGALPCVMKKAPRKLRATKGIAASVDFRRPDFYTASNAPAGYAMHSSAMSAASQGSQQRLECEITTVANAQIKPGGQANNKWYSTQANQYIPVTPPARPSAIAAAASYLNGQTNPLARREQGITRLTLSLPPASGNPVRAAHSAYPAYASPLAPSVPNSYQPQDYFMFGAAYGGASPLANCTLNQVVIFSEELTEDEINQLARFNGYGMPALFFWGDSLNNNQMTMDAVLMELANAGYSYIPAMSEGQGAHTLNFHKDCLAAYTTQWPHLKDYALILFEGGLEGSGPNLQNVTEGPFSELDYLRYLRDISTLFRQQYKLIMLPHTNQAAWAGPSVLGPLNTNINHWPATYPAHVVDWQPELQMEAVDSATYVSLRADQKSPPELLAVGEGNTSVHLCWVRSDDITPGGYKPVARGIVKKLVKDGFVPPRQAA